MQSHDATFKSLCLDANLTTASQGYMSRAYKNAGVRTVSSQRLNRCIRMRPADTMLASLFISKRRRVDNSALPSRHSRVYNAIASIQRDDDGQWYAVVTLPCKHPWAYGWERFG